MAVESPRLNPLLCDLAQKAEYCARLQWLLDWLSERCNGDDKASQDLAGTWGYALAEYQDAIANLKAAINSPNMPKLPQEVGL